MKQFLEISVVTLILGFCYLGSLPLIMIDVLGKSYLKIKEKMKRLTFFKSY